MVDQGFRFFKKIEKHEYDPNVNTYNTIIDGLCRVGKVKIAHNVLKGMVKRGHQLSPNILSYCGLKPTSITYNTLIQGLYEAKRFDKIKEILKGTLGGGGLIPDTCTFNTLITYHCNMGNMDEEIQVFENMLKLKEPDSSTYSILIRGFSQKGYFKRAEKLFDDIMKKKVLLCSDGCTPLVAAYNPMFEYLCRIVKTKKAEKVFRQLMRRGTQDLFAYELLIMGHCKEGTFNDAYELLVLMLRIYYVPNIVIYESLIESLLQKSEPKVAYDTLEKMLKCSHLLRSSNFHQILTELIKKKCASECFSLVKLMLDNKVRQSISLLTDTVRILFLAGLKEKAFEILRCLYENEYMVCIWYLNYMATLAGTECLWNVIKSVIWFRISISWQLISLIRTTLKNIDDRKLNSLEVAGSPYGANLLLNNFGLAGAMVKRRGSSFANRSNEPVGRGARQDSTHGGGRFWSHQTRLRIRTQTKILVRMLNVLEALVPYQGQAPDPHATSQTQAQLHLNVATSQAPQPVDHSVVAVGQPKDIKTFIDLKPPEFDATPSTIEPQKFIDHFTDPRVKVRKFMDVLEARYRGPMIWDVRNGSYAEVVDTSFLLSLIMRWKGLLEKTKSQATAQVQRDVEGTHSHPQAARTAPQGARGHGRQGAQGDQAAGGPPRFFSMARQDIDASNAVVTGIITINCHEAYYLTDPGSTYLYVPPSFALFSG
ncbi:Pentatricopeptide repeat-containing protein, chloroplastic [Capsicum baccatum]|uniref:Pentatricopeptide repeat-containing protein, chloroplastic n=1 Tax=Capsicum baccatum TaxID=33114 RepID=A0A2G2X614_CAPBA|nr:Pentatricopeptide repeat-containing protein, chloroplastic [Capsicum baccatum]